MRSVLWGVLGLLAVQAPAMAASPSACEAVGIDWRAAGFSAPAKPAQARVVGNAGYMTSGTAYRRMVQAIHHACAPGSQADAVRQAALAESLLHDSKGGL